jgi:hypothetical protein
MAKMDSVLISNKIASKNRSKRIFVCQEWTNQSDVADVHVKRLENQANGFNESSKLILYPTKRYSVLDLPMDPHSESCYEIEISPKYAAGNREEAGNWKQEENDLIKITFCSCQDSTKRESSLLSCN